MNIHQSERGQTLVLIILAIATIFGFAALAVDGGHLFAERRRAQSAADSAALAAARKGASLGTQTDIQYAGYNVATENGFTNDGRTTVIINHPPVSGPYTGNSEYYQAVITTTIDPIFAQFVFGGAQVITTEAVTRAADIEPASGGNAIFAVNPSKDIDGIVFDGNITINVDGGNIFSNTNARDNGSTVHSGIVETTNGGKILISGSLTLNPDNCGPGTGMNPCALENVDHQSPPDVPEPYCPPEDITTNPTNYDGVDYYVWTSSRHYPLTLPKGIHCFYNGITLNGNDRLQGDEVLLVLKQGDIALGGNSEVNLTRASDIKDRNGNQYGGMLLYVPETNIQEECDCKRSPIITLGGTNNTRINGTVYAPKATCDLGGTNEANAYHAAFICDNFKFHGNRAIHIIYKDAENYTFAPSISVTQ